MISVLVSEELLNQQQEAIEKAVTIDSDYIVVDEFDRRALLYHLLFADGQALKKVGFNVSPDQAFFNSYFWYLVASNWEDVTKGRAFDLDDFTSHLLERQYEDVGFECSDDDLDVILREIEVLAEKKVSDAAALANR